MDVNSNITPPMDLEDTKKAAVPGIGTATIAINKQDSKLFPPMRFSDFTVIVSYGNDETSIYLSKHLIERFNSSVMNVWLEDAEASQIVLKEDRIPASRYEQFFIFLCQQNFKLQNMDETYDIFTLAHKYSISNLIDVCTTSIKTAPTPRGVAMMFLFGYKQKATEIINGMKIARDYCHSEYSPFDDVDRLQRFMHYFIENHLDALAKALLGRILAIKAPSRY